MFNIFLHYILHRTWGFSKKILLLKVVHTKKSSTKRTLQLSPMAGQIRFQSTSSQNVWSTSPLQEPHWPPKLLVKQPKAGHRRENPWICPQGPWEDTPDFPFHTHKERNSFINCWWNVRGIFQGYVGEILEKHVDMKYMHPTDSRSPAGNMLLPEKTSREGFSL